MDQRELILYGKVDCVFTISGRGTVVSFDFVPGLDPNVKVGVGDKIELRAPGGPALQTEVKGIEFLKPIVRRKPVDIGILLPPTVDPKTLSEGMEIWLLSDV